MADSDPMMRRLRSIEAIVDITESLQANAIDLLEDQFDMLRRMEAIVHDREATGAALSKVSSRLTWLTSALLAVAGLLVADILTRAFFR